jgi:hypothetical protein
MDMKKILQALDGASQKPVEGSSDMKKFVKIVNEGTNPHKVSLPVQMVMNHYQTPKKEKLEEVSVFKTYVAVVEDELATKQSERKQLIRQYSQQIAESVLKKNVSERVTIGPDGQVIGGLKPTAPDPDAPPRPVAPAEPPATLPGKSLPRVDSANRDAQTVTVDGQEYQMIHLEPGGIRPRGGQRYSIPLAMLGIRSIGNLIGILVGDKMYVLPKGEQESINENKSTLKVPVAQKPRQGPLRPQTGAGAHRDKKKEQKQGKEKHKKPVYELADVDTLINQLDEIKKGQKDSNGYTKCWPGKHAEGTKKGKNGKPVRNCVPNESVDESKKKPNATTRHLKDYPVSDKDMAKPVKKPEKKKPEQSVAEAVSAAQQAAIAIAKKKKAKK